jgi:hypothetical protein
MKTNATPVRVYDIAGADGKSIGLFRVDSEWEGLLKLSRIGGGGVIIGSPAERSLFAPILGGDPATEVTVISASPELAARLAEPQSADGARRASGESRG